MYNLSSAIGIGRVKIKESGKFWVNLALVLLILFLGMTYFFGINNMASDSLRIKSLAAKLDDLEASHKKLELESSSLQSAASIEDLAKQLNLVPAANVTYLKDENFALK
jgi:cell division protein FtsB